jgi:hypothetical protein
MVIAPVGSVTPRWRMRVPGTRTAPSPSNRIGTPSRSEAWSNCKRVVVGAESGVERQHRGPVRAGAFGEENHQLARSQGSVYLVSRVAGAELALSIDEQGAGHASQSARDVELDTPQRAARAGRARLNLVHRLFPQRHPNLLHSAAECSV